jgi:predicted nucleic acid-binding protein
VTLLDTDVMIEIQRARPEALAWLPTISDNMALPAVVALELLMGSRDKAELDRAARFVATFDVEQFDPRDGHLAVQLVERYRLSTGLGLADFLVAAQALNRSATLYSFNSKHYQPIAGLDIQLPYER